MIELTLPDMTCGHCVKTVTTTVHNLDADARVTIDLVKHHVQVESSTASRDAIVQALAEEGYPAA